MVRQKSKSLLTRQLENRRRKAGQMLRTTTLSKAEIARRLGVSRAAVTQWSQLMKKKGNPEGLFAWARPGRPPRLSDADWRRVLKRLGRGPKSSGFSAGRWTLKLVQQYIEREYATSYSLSYLAEKLHALNWATPLSVTRRVMRNERQRIKRPPEEDPGRAIGRAIRRTYF